MNAGEPTRKLSFQRPTVTKKHYLAVGSGGWVECFDRKTCDEALAKMIGDLSLDHLIDNFMESIRLANQKQPYWHDVTRYLGRVLSIHPDKIHPNVGIGFWAAIEIRQQLVKG